jgi:hypothetical protein
MSTKVVVLQPNVKYGEVAAAFGAAGWRGGPITLTAALVPGEPELAAWRYDDTVARYDCNPVVWLRVLRVSGTAALPPLPALQRHDVHRLLSSSTPDHQLLGLLAAAELTLAEAAPAVARLATCSVPAVSTAARRALTQLRG